MTRKSVSRAGATLACLPMLSVGAPTVSAKTITGNTSPQDHEKVASLAYERTADCGDVDLIVVKPTGGNEFDNPQTIGQIADIEFTAQKLAGYDLTTAEGWKKARALTEKEAEKGPFDGDKVSARTDAEGKAYFQGLEVGLYLVKEVVPENPQGAYKQSVPLLITLPIGFKGSTDDPNPRWDCRVEVNTKVKKPSTPPDTPEVPPLTPPITPPKTPPATPPKTPPAIPPQSSVPPTPTPGTPEEATLGGGIRGVIARTGITAPSLFVGLGLLLIAALVLVLRRKKDTAADDA